MTEVDFWKKIRAAWPGHAMRIEASEGGVDPGTPDSHLSIGGRGAFVELKVWPEPLNPMQYAWHVDAVDKGAGAWVWCWVDYDCIWMGLGEDYADYCETNSRPKGKTLGHVIDRLSKILQSRANVI